MEPGTSPPTLRPVPRANGRRARRQAETRARILRAAWGLFARQGYAATTVEQITEAADVGKGTFFNYFSSKEHVLAGFAEGQVGRIEELLAAARQGRTPMREILRRLLLSLSEEPARSPELFRSLIVANFSSAPVRQLTRKNFEAARRRLAELLALGQERGEIRRDRSAQELARFIQQNGFGALVLWAIHPTAGLAEWQQTTAAILWEALGTGARGRGRARRA